MSAYSEKKYEVIDIGIMHPEQVITGYLYVIITLYRMMFFIVFKNQVNFFL